MPTLRPFGLLATHVAAYAMLALAWLGCQPASAPSTSGVPSVKSGYSADPTAPPSGSRAAALTFDDLPHGRLADYPREWVVDVNERLLDTLKSYGVASTGFVNGANINTRGESYEDVIAMWDESGMDLGNHSWSHANFWNLSVEEFEVETSRSDSAIADAVSAFAVGPKFFRHPYLNTGPDSTSKAEFEMYLSESGYRVAPVTVDTWDFMYARAYDNQIKGGDVESARAVASAYLEHIDASFTYYEKMSNDLFGRDISHVLLLHVSRLNADYVGAIIRGLRDEGVSIVPLEAALEDAAYDEPDLYIGERGISWLERWAVSKRIPVDEEPTPPEWIRDLAYPTSS